jgi:hypothetical protein
MTDAERREAARQFYQKWVGRGREDEDDRSYWLDILERILGVENATDHIDFQKKVIVDGNTKRIDAYIPETKVIIEQKTLGIALDKKGHQSGGIELTPYEQAKRYNDNLPYDEKARWIITSNFAEIWIYDMNARVPEPVKLNLSDLQSKYSVLDILVNQEQTRLTAEMEISVKAGELVGIIYDALYKQYIDPESERALKSLNMLCVRLVFCLYAEDAGIFGNNHHMFHDYLQKFDAPDIRKALIELFKILDTKPEDRDPYDTSALSKFPYVNGGLFADENIEIPHFTEEIKHILLANASDDFDWSAISPTIFGAVFESTLNPETRRSGGMHYTSIENIHKVIDPLFLDSLNKEFEDIKKLTVEKTRTAKLKAFQNKLSGLKWLDPACGSGNFLTETYISIRRLENKVLQELQHGQIVFGDVINPIQVSINQFYGIEINDFAVTVAKTALWIAESQMMKETEDVVHMNLDFLPLKTNANIVEGNALSIRWEDIIPNHELNYIMGNPPFVGHKNVSPEQKNDMKLIFNNKQGRLDYVAAWYMLASRYIQNSKVECSFVSTNTVVQGTHVESLWNALLNDYKIKINFAYNTFKWESEATQKAAVFCVIIGFSLIDKKEKLLFEAFDQSATNGRIVNYISPYLDDKYTVVVESQNKPISERQPMVYGNIPRDGGFYTFTDEEKEEFLLEEPNAAKFMYRFLGSKEYINNTQRWILFLKDAEPQELRALPKVMERIQAVKEFRLSSKAKEIHKFAETPTLFAQQTQPVGEPFVIVPIVSSSRRRYIPMGYVDGNTIVNNRVFLIPNADLFMFGILNSNVHNAWMRKVAVRLKDDYSYSKDLVYNTFPIPELTEAHKNNIAATAQAILDARELYPNSSLADLYDPLTMPHELKKAHIQNDKAVMQAYGFSIKDTSETDCVEALMKMYEQQTK